MVLTQQVYSLAEKEAAMMVDTDLAYRSGQAGYYKKQVALKWQQYYNPTYPIS